MFGKRPSKAARSKAARSKTARLGFESLESRIVMSGTGFDDSLVGESAAVVQTASTSSAPPAVAALLSVEEWVQSLAYWQFAEVQPNQVQYLTSAQLASIPNVSYFSAMSPASRAALNAAQVRSLNIAAVGLGQLTATQIGQLTVAQVQQVKYWEFEYLFPTQVPYLTSAQLGTLNSLASFAAMSSASREALTSAQVRSLDIAAVGLSQLTAAQIGQLAAGQVQQVKYWEFELLPPSQIPNLTSVQLASIPSVTTLSRMSSASRTALTSAQVRSLNIAAVGLSQLTSTQIGQLTVEQVQQVKYWEFQRLFPAQVPYLTSAQLGTLNSLASFAAMSPASRAALTSAQVRALDIAAVGLGYLTSTQIGQLTVEQVQQVKYWEFQYLFPLQVPYLTSAQLASLPSVAPLAAMPAASRAALTSAQIRSLNIATVGLGQLTPTQIGQLTVAQVQQVKYWEFGYLFPLQVPYLTSAQLGTLTSLASFAAMAPASRAALTSAQVRLLNISAVGISQLTSTQIGQLTVPQVQQVKYWEFELLLPSQIPILTINQIRSVPTGGVLIKLPDESRRALTREQILSLSPEQLISLVGPEIEQLPPANYVPVVDRRGSGDSHSHESMKFFDLAPLSNATHVAIASGSWSDPKIWRNGQVPSAGARVVVPAGAVVVFDAYMNSAIKTLRIDGTLTFAVDRNTQLKADTVVVYTTGKLHVGTEASPIRDNVTARILIADGGPIDRVWDPYGLSRGVLSGGEVRMYGKDVTSYVTLATDPKAGDTVLKLSSIPSNWKVGDKLMISGTNPYTADLGAEQVTIRAISGSTVTVDRLVYNHDAPDGMGLSIYVANLSRNIILEAEDPSVVSERPHMVFFGNPNVQIEDIAVTGFGRTDKSIPINDPIVINGVLQPGTGLNPRARYAVHFHHTGVDPLVAPARVSGSVVTDSPGWGYVNHQSNVIFEENVALNVSGASFVTEDGNEIGQFTRNLSINSISASADSMHSRRAAHDFGFSGHGFWMQGPGVELVGNIAAGSGLSGFVYYTASAKSQFDAVNLEDPELAGGRKIVPVGLVPIKRFEDNVSIASQIGMEVWFNQLNMNDGRSVIDRFTSWNTIHAGIGLHYSGNVDIRNAKLIGNMKAFTGTGVTTNAFSHDVAITNLVALGFSVGIDVPVRGATTINGAMISAVQGIYIEKGHDTVRSVAMIGQLAFSTPTVAQSQGRTPWRVYLAEPFNFKETIGRRVESYLAADEIVWAPYGATPQRLYFSEQLRDYVPFPTLAAAGYVPDVYIGKTNYQLWSQYGVAFNGQYLNGTETVIPGIRGYAGSL